jgi:secondary thiamine-phosphate synthase enzyme
MTYEFSLQTPKENLINISGIVKEAVKKSGVQDGICIIYCPHTTAGITINENADPDVVRDMLLGLDTAFPDRREFRHVEGNSSAHLKSSCVGVNQTVIIRKGELLLGTWQGIYFCEFDGPRSRRFLVKIIKEN